jgi:hypothetical protein
MAYHCPKCGSDDLMSARMLCESGTSVIDTRTRGRSSGIGVAGGHIGVGVAGSRSRTQGSQVTALAQRYAPPVPEGGGGEGEAIGAVVLGVIGFYLAYTPLAALGLGGWSVLFGLVGAVMLPMPLLRRAERARKVVDARNVEQRRAWERLWVCLRCGGAGDESGLAAASS